MFLMSEVPLYIHDVTPHHTRISTMSHPTRTTLQKNAEVLRRAHIQGSSTLVSLNSRRESEKEEEDVSP